MKENQILLVEDDPGIRETLTLFLELENYSVASAENGKEALGVLTGSFKPGVILLDLMMPIMNGWEFLKELAKDREYASTPVIVISAYPDKFSTLAAGVGVLEKPIDLNKLQTRLTQIFDRPT